MTDITKRLRELSAARWDREAWERETTVRIPAEPERDIDLVLLAAAKEIERLRAELTALRESEDGWRQQAAQYMQHALDYQKELDKLQAKLAALREQEPLITKREKGLILHAGWDGLPTGTKLYAAPVPSRDDEALLQQCLNSLDPCDATRWQGMANIRAATIKALRERLG